MTKTTLYLHIGYHKTGSTSLQTWLEQNRDALARAGVCYPVTQRDNQRNYYSKHLQLYSRIAHAHRVGDAPQAEVRQEFAPYLREIEASGCKTAVLSEESFSDLARLGPEAIPSLGFLSDHFDVRILAVLRRQDEFLQSFYHQAIKSGQQRDFPTFILKGDWTRLYYFSALGRWAEVFGRENIIVRSYDRDQAAGLVQNLLDIIQPEPGALTGQERHWNASIPSICYEILRQCFRDGFDADEAVALLKRMEVTARRSPQLREHEVFKRDFLTPNVRANLRDMFAEANARTSKTYFGGEDVFAEFSACSQRTAPLAEEPPRFLPRETAGALGRIMLRHAAVEADLPSRG